MAIKQGLFYPVSLWPGSLEKHTPIYITDESHVKCGKDPLDHAAQLAVQRCGHGCASFPRAGVTCLRQEADCFAFLI